MGAPETWPSLIVTWAYLGILAMSRVGGIMLVLPSFISRDIPRMVKGSVVIAFSIIFALISPNYQEITPSFGFEIGALILLEAIYGTMIGIIATIVIHGVRIGGQIIGIEMGLSFAAIADPLSPGSSTVLSTLMGTFAAQLFIALGYDRLLLRALAHSIQRRPLGTASIDPEIFIDFVLLGSEMMFLALRIALPVIGTLFTLKLSMAYLARVAPSLQIFSLTFVLTLIVGHWILVASAPSFGLVIAEELEHAMALVWALVR